MVPGGVLISVDFQQEQYAILVKTLQNLRSFTTSGAMTSSDFSFHLTNQVECFIATVTGQLSSNLSTQMSWLGRLTSSDCINEAEYQIMCQYFVNRNSRTATTHWWEQKMPASRGLILAPEGLQAGPMLSLNGWSSPDARLPPPPIFNRDVAALSVAQGLTLQSPDLSNANGSIPVRIRAVVPPVAPGARSVISDVTSIASGTPSQQTTGGGVHAKWFGYDPPIQCSLGDMDSVLTDPRLFGGYPFRTKPGGRKSVKKNNARLMDVHSY